MIDLHEGEKIKYIRGFEGKYSITSDGRVWHHRLKRWMSQWIDKKNGYSRVSFTVDGKEYNPRIHRLVAIAFIKNKNKKPQVNHINGNKNDNKASNLEWVTARENLQHACDLGLNSHFKLSEQDKVIICQMYKSKKMRKVDLARYFNMSSSGILYIIKAYGNQVGHA